MNSRKTNVVRVFVIGPNNERLMPTERVGKVYRMLKSGLAEVIYTIPFTIRLKYEPKTKIVQKTALGFDPGRTNLGVCVIREDGKCLYRAHVQTRNKQIPKLMEDRAIHRKDSRGGERLRRKRRAKKNNTIMKNGSVSRLLPGCKKTFVVKEIINTEARFINKKVSKGWLTATATQLLRTYLNVVALVQKILPITSICVEVNKFLYIALDYGGYDKLNTNFKGPLTGYSGNLNDYIDDMQGGICLLCGKRSIEHHHHMQSKHSGGSNTVDNVVGLCNKCHFKVHTNNEAKEKLSLLHIRRGKKYGALSVINQIIPKFIQKLSDIFDDNLYVTTGYRTAITRRIFNVKKDHDVDAYCIATQAFDNEIVSVDREMPDIYEIVQFRRQNRSIIHCQHERTYKLGKRTVAKNRRKRIDQFDDSLHEWYLKMKNQFGKLEAKRMQSRLTVITSSRRYNDLKRIKPGAIFEYDGKQYIMASQKDYGNYYMPFGCRGVWVSTRKSKLLCKNRGLIYVPKN